MPQVTFISPDGAETVVHAPDGSTALEAAQANGVPMLGTCGGSMVCATCHVMVTGASRGLVPPRGDDEAVTLELAFGATGDSRLACQLRLAPAQEGLVIHLAPTMLWA